MACSLHENAILMQAPYRQTSSSPSRESHEDTDDEPESSDVELSPCHSRQSRRRASPSTCVFETQRKVQKRRSSQGLRSERQKREEAPMLSRHSPWLWVRFSLTLAFAVAAAVREGPGALMVECARNEARGERRGRDGEGRARGGDVRGRDGDREGDDEGKECGCLKCLGREMARCA
jgi:hypothetical protein